MSFMVEVIFVSNPTSIVVVVVGVVSKRISKFIADWLYEAGYF